MLEKWGGHQQPRHHAAIEQRTTKSRGQGHQNAKDIKSPVGVYNYLNIAYRLIFAANSIR